MYCTTESCSFQSIVSWSTSLRGQSSAPLWFISLYPSSSWDVCGIETRVDTVIGWNKNVSAKYILFNILNIILHSWKSPSASVTSAFVFQDNIDECMTSCHLLININDEYTNDCSFYLHSLHNLRKSTNWPNLFIEIVSAYFHWNGWCVNVFRSISNNNLHDIVGVHWNQST